MQMETEIACKWISIEGEGWTSVCESEREGEGEAQGVEINMTHN